jgi:DNA invertase Pin-like site-specific DNA recombinase/predicted DNA-binding WGR domain protein
MKYGYARVSTDGQSVGAQVVALREAGAEKIFKEVASGAKTDRAQLHRLLKVLDEGDVLLVTRLDRLARSTRDLLNTLATITGKKAGFRSLADAWADTTTAHGRLMLTILAGLAEFERELIRARTGEGRARAKARGVKMGRKFKLTPHQQREARARRANGEALTEDRPQLQRQSQHHIEAQAMSATVLYRIDDTRRMYRYYRLDVQPNLFEEWCLMREWGRIGSTGQARSLPFSTPQEAEAALDKQRHVKERRGYSQEKLVRHGG